MRWHNLLLFLIFLRCSTGLVCPIPAATPGGSLRNKTCPDFKANPTFVHCCASKLPPTNTLLKEKHGVYCCSLEDFEKEKQDMANQELRNFLKDYLALIIFGSVLVISLLVIVTAIVCKKIPGCPMYQSIHMITRSNESPSALYRPVDQIPPKMYEAPPPYECFVPPPVVATSSTDNNEWNCILENEVNGSRRTPPQIS
ncbi:Protein shisa-9 [Caenorhabditis elegans]|uniref:Protein shisa-9 n=2 Tax=Caenorhabditis elegans TaxID=6239 RepID=Q4R106_CAEEL|nr:Protein shisa-9 [Caenorhabditis elegans]CCD65359.1 Protein shisa-9 [Caenorhabditis elegans]|eukprot:NP_001033426.1 Uncharacterized protein CELE_R05C11.4 [Caenorhabditis elegans]